MELLDGFETVDGYPGVFCEPLDALVLSDLHIGIEAVEARSGTLIPAFQLEELLEEIEEMAEITGASRLIVTGDLKHSFSGNSRREREELGRFLREMSMLFEEVSLVEGNHDNGLGYRIEEFTNVSLEDSIVEEGFLFVHGHEEVRDLAALGADVVVMGHEHPAVSLQDDAGVSEKLRCFLYGPMGDGREVLVLPAFTKLASGTEVNEVPVHELLSPMLQDIDVDRLKVVAVDREAGVFEYPELGKLRGL